MLPPKQICPLCPDAHNLLAAASSSYEEALEHYVRGEAVGLQVRGCCGAQAQMALPAQQSAWAPILLAGLGASRLGGSRQPCLMRPPWSARLQVVPPERLQGELDREDVWLRMVVRPYLRCAAGLQGCQ